MNNQQVIDFVT